MATTAIEWTEKTWNPVLGCDKVSPGCAHCYAAVMAKRLRAMALADIAAGRDPGLKRHYVDVVNDRGQWTGKLVTIPEKLDEPMRAKKPTSYFVNSMSDLFHADVSDEFISAVFGVMTGCLQHTFQVLTKRSERMLEWARFLHEQGGLGRYIRSEGGRLSLRGMFDAVAKTEVVNGRRSRQLSDPWMQVMNGAAAFMTKQPPQNVLIGPSIEDQKTAEKRMPAARELEKLGWRVMLSVEPLLEAVQLGSLDGIAWVIVGGESGPKARACDVAWVRSIVEQCREAGVACFVKQLGSNPRGHCADGNRAGKYIFDKKGGEPAEWPEDLRVRQMPVAAR